MTWVCPCCGAAHDGEDPSTWIPGDVTGNHRLVAMMLLEKPRTAEELVRDLYGNRPDGGPQSALSNVRVAIHRLRRRLPDVGLRVVNLKGSAGGQGNRAIYGIAVDRPGLRDGGEDG